MKVTHRIVVSSGLLLLFLLAVLAYNLVQLRRLVEIQEGVTRIDFSATTSALELTRLLGELKRTGKKLLVSRDRGYAERLDAIEAAFFEELGRLEALPLKAPQRLAARRLVQLWGQVPVEELRQTARAESVIERTLEDEIGAAFEERADAVAAQAEAINLATQATVAADVAAAVEASQRVATVSKVAMVVVVTVSLPLLFFTVSSIREPLRQLREGARSVGEGSFDFELETRGDDEFAGVAASFNEMVRRLGELDRLKREFLSHVSHELKAPLAAMQETLRALLEEVPGELNERQKRLLALNLQSNDRLSAMIGKLLDLARLEEGGDHYEMRAHEMTELVQEVAEGFAAAALEKGVRLEITPPTRPVVAVCDRNRIIQVVGNLVENAIKFSPAGGTVTLATLEPADRPDGPISQDAAVIQVADRGPGIPDDQKDTVFRRFHQIGRPGTSSGGVGLGLAICREIAAAHQGAVWVENNGDRGSLFCLSLPLAGSASGEQGREAS